MGKHGDAAKELFVQGYNCSQSVLGAFCPDAQISLDTALKISCGFGGGVGRQRGLCGAVSGMCMAYGLARGYSQPDEAAKIAAYEDIRTLCAEFRAVHSSLICAELLGEQPNGAFALPEKRTEHYYATRPCGEYVAFAADILEAFLNK